MAKRIDIDFLPHPTAIVQLARTHQRDCTADEVLVNRT